MQTRNTKKVIEELNKENKMDVEFKINIAILVIFVFIIGMICGYISCNLVQVYLF